MKQLLFTLLTFLAAPLASSDLWFHMHVQGERGERVAINLPFQALARTLPVLVEAADRHCREDHHCRVVVNGREIDSADFHDIVNAIREARGAEPVVVKSGESELQAVRSGDALVIRVANSWEGRKSELRMPVWLADALTAGSTDQMNVRNAINTIVARKEGSLSVTGDDGAVVRMWVDRSIE